MRNFESISKAKKPFREKYNLVSIILLLNVTSNAFCPSKLFLEGVVR